MRASVTASASHGRGTRSLTNRRPRSTATCAVRDEPGEGERFRGTDRWRQVWAKRGEGGGDGDNEAPRPGTAHPPDPESPMTSRSAPKRRALRPLLAKLTALCLLTAQVGPTFAATCSGKTLPGTNLSGGEFNSG